MLTEMLNSDNALVKYGVATLVVFGPLYILSSFGVDSTFLVAVLVLMVVIVVRARGN